MPKYVNQLVPMLNTNDIQETMRFYVEKLGFSVTGTWPDGDQPTWCSLAAGSAVAPSGIVTTSSGTSPRTATSITR